MNTQQSFDPEAMLTMMGQKMGGQEYIPKAMVHAKNIAPELMQQTMLSSMGSVNDEQSPLDSKTRQFVYLGAALATHDQECIQATFHTLKTMGVSNDELLAVIKIVRHAANNGVLGAATSILAALDAEVEA